MITLEILLISTPKIPKTERKGEKMLFVYQKKLDNGLLGGKIDLESTFFTWLFLCPLWFCFFLFHPDLLGNFLLKNII